MAEQHQFHAGEEKVTKRRQPTPGPASLRSWAAPLHPVLRLQRQIGNQAMVSLLAQRQAEEEEELQTKRDTALQRAAEEEEELQASHDAALQRAVDEEEEVQAKPDAALQRASEEEEEIQARHDPSLQRQTEEPAASMQRRPEVGPAGGPVSQATAQQIHALRGNGQPLDTGTRATMERAFNTTFSDVRLHTGREASDLNFRLGAQAFTAGSDIFLRDDVYRPGTAEAQRLLAHELTHVVQQRSMAPSGGTQVRPAGDAYEQEADAAADRVMQRLATEET